MIVSASYRTDIPAFYGQWFRNRLAAGYAVVANPYGGPDYRVSLRREEVDGFVFWTKNLGPFLDTLSEVRGGGFPFVVQYSINGFPRELEWSVTDAERSVEHMRRLEGEYGPYVPVWRYDTIVFSSLTPPDFHRANFERLSRALEGAANEVVVSFAQIYKKTRRNMDAAARALRFTWNDPDDESKAELAKDLAGMAAARGMRFSVCSQRRFLAPGIEDAACIDAGRLSLAAGYRIGARRKGNREECGCHESRDIGAYDTCPHGCVYCYAVNTRVAARRAYVGHDPEAERLGERS